MQAICTSLQTDNYASNSSLKFLRAGCPSCHTTNRVKALKANRTFLMCIYSIIILRRSDSQTSHHQHLASDYSMNQMEQNDKHKKSAKSNTRSLAVTTNTMMSMSSPNFSRNRRTVPEITYIRITLQLFITINKTTSCC